MNGGPRRSPISSPMPEVPSVQLSENEALENLGVFLTRVWNHTSLELAPVPKAVQNLKATEQETLFTRCRRHLADPSANNDISSRSTDRRGGKLRTPRKYGQPAGGPAESRAVRHRAGGTAVPSTSVVSRDPLSITGATAQNGAPGEHSPAPERSKRPSSPPPLFVAFQAGSSSTSGPGLRPGQRAAGGVGWHKTGRVNRSGHNSLATSLLVPVSVLHLATTLRMPVLALIEATNDMRSRIPSSGDRTFISIILYALMFSYLNHGINCYVYFVSSARFRAHRRICNKLACCSCIGLRPPSIPSIGTSKRCSFDTRRAQTTLLAENTAVLKQHPNTVLSSKHNNHYDNITRQ